MNVALDDGPFSGRGTALGMFDRRAQRWVIGIAVRTRRGCPTDGEQCRWRCGPAYKTLPRSADHVRLLVRLIGCCGVVKETLES